MPRLFQAGQSGNPRGRPTDSVKAAALRKRILKSAPDVIDAMITAALAGDMNAGRALLVCAVPPLKPVELPICLEIPQDEGLAAQGRAVIAALASGDIAPGQASQILTALAGIARLVELDELEKRLLALEQHSTGESVRPVIVHEDEDEEIDEVLPE